MKKLILSVGFLLCAQQEALASAPSLSDPFARASREAFRHVLENMDLFRERAIRARDQEIASRLRALPTAPRHVILEFLQEQLQEGENESAELEGTHKKLQLERADELVTNADRVEFFWGKPELARCLQRVAKAMKERAQRGLGTEAARVGEVLFPSEREEAMSVEDQIIVEFFEIMRDCTHKNKEAFDNIGRKLKFLKGRSDSAVSLLSELQQQAQEARESLRQLQEDAQARESRLVSLEVAQQRERYLLSSLLVGIFGVIVWQLLMVGN